jgi:hypothetical protein
MRRGEVWWAEFDERRPVVLLSGEDPSGFQAMLVVAPADTGISGLGICSRIECSLSDLIATVESNRDSFRS